MMITFGIAQTESLLAGCEAPNSTEQYPVPVNSLPYTLKLQILPLWDMKTKRIVTRDATRDKNGMISGPLPVIVKPFTLDKAIAALKKLMED